MSPKLLPADDKDRLKALYSYQILDTLEERDFDDLTGLAAVICQVPIVLISLVDETRQWFKSHFGLNASETPIEQSFCAHAIMSTNEMMIVENASLDDRFKNNPLVTGAPNITFYAGVPLANENGYSLGTLCVIDSKPKSLSNEQKNALQIIARQVMDKLELRRKISQLQQSYETIHEGEKNINKLYAELQQNDTRRRAFIDQSPVPLIVFRGDDFIIDSVNQAMLELLNKTGEILSKPLLQAIPELDGQEPYLLLKVAYGEGRSISADKREVKLYKKGSADVGYYNFSYSPLIENGKIVGVIDMAVNVTAQVLAQQATEQLNEELIQANTNLAASEENLRLLADNISQLAWMADVNGYIYWYNNRWFDYTGTTLDEMKGSGWHKVHHPEHIERVVEKYNNDIIQKGAIWEDIFPLRGKDGEYRWFLSRAVPFKDNQGKILRWFGTNTDITQQREMLAQREDFISIASHELKTPITSLKASLQMLDRLKDEASPMIANLIDVSKRSMVKITTLVDDLLDVASINKDHSTLSRRVFDVTKIITSCCDDLSVKGHHQLVFSGESSLKVFADEHKIEQVIVNFINNTVKYAPESPEITVKAEQIGAMAKISVIDSGPGISADRIPQLFKRYYRGTVNSSQYAGLGLGLYICAQIIKQHGGEIGVDSKVGEGSTFWFTLPLDKAE